MENIPFDIDKSMSKTKLEIQKELVLFDGSLGQTYLNIVWKERLSISEWST